MNQHDSKKYRKAIRKVPEAEGELEAVPNVVQFYWKTKELLKQASSIVMELKKEYDATLVKICSRNPATLLPSPSL